MLQMLKHVVLKTLMIIHSEGKAMEVYLGGGDLDAVRTKTESI